MFRDGLNQLAVQFGGVGDMVLTSELIASLKAWRPKGTVTLVCRRNFIPVAGFFPVPPDNVIGLDINPHLIDRPSEDLRRTLENVARQFQGPAPRILIEGSLRPTWLTRFLAALLEPQLSLCCGFPEEPESVLGAALAWFRIERREFAELGLPPEIGERDRYGLLLDYLGAPRVPRFPWRLSAQNEAKALGWLNSHGLGAGSYVLCFPGGEVNVPLKRWPATNFVHAIDSIRRQGHAVLLFGSPDEEQELGQIAQALESGPVPVFCGDLSLGMAITSQAKAYLGNDTGPMHVAQAFGVPGVAIFSGGYWPRYAPWAPGTVAMVHPLPCFSCNHDCLLGHGLCVESIPVDPVTVVLLELLSGRSPDAIQSLQTMNPALIPILRDANSHYRLVQRDRAERLKVILLLDAEVERLRAERLEAAPGRQTSRPANQ